MAFSSTKKLTLKGDTGSTGATGPAAGFGDPTATATTVAVDGSGNSQAATASVAESGPDTAKIFAFTLGVPVGTTGATGATGPSGTIESSSASASGVAVGGSPTATITLGGTASARTMAFAFGIPVGATGATGTVDTTTDYTWTGTQRGTVLAANSGAMDMDLSNNFSITPTGSVQLTFSHETAGQSGYIVLSNTNGYAVTKESTIKGGSAFLTDISAAGTYVIAYHTLNASNVYVSNSVALS